MLKEFLLYNRTSGFNILKFKNVDHAINYCEWGEDILLDPVSEFDPIILSRIRKLLED